jgi:hypothetical protein
MTGSGKIQKFHMREISLPEFSAEKATAVMASA